MPENKAVTDSHLNKIGLSSSLFAADELLLSRSNQLSILLAAASEPYEVFLFVSPNN